MGHENAKVIDGWLVCACGQKLVQIDDARVKIVRRGTVYTGESYSIIVPPQLIKSACQCKPE